MAFNRVSYLQKVEDIQKITQEQYEAGRQDRNYGWVHRNHIEPVYRIGYVAYLRILNINVASERRKERRGFDGSKEMWECRSLFEDEDIDC